MKEAIRIINVYPKFAVKNEAKEKAYFLKDLRLAGNFIAKKLGKDFIFEIDERNSEIIEQLWFYITGSPRFIGAHKKGIFLSGNIGTGKTVLMLAFLEVLRRQLGKSSYEVLFPDNMHKVFTEKGLEHYQLRTLLIDDMCREPNNVKDYGRLVDPVRELTMYRNRYPCQSYATANFPVYKNGRLLVKNELVQRYGVMVFDRMKEQYNFLELTGKSRR